MMYYKKVYQERGGGADNHHKTEGFLNGSKWFCGEGGGGGFSRVKAQKEEFIELTSMIKLDPICSIVYH